MHNRDTKPKAEALDVYLERRKSKEYVGRLVRAKNQGKNGMPAAPAGSATAKPNPEGQAKPDPTAQAELEKQQQEADQAEKEVQVAQNDGVSN